MNIKSLFRKKENLLNRPVFLERLSVLLIEGYTFHDAVTLLVPHHLKNYTPLLVEMNNDFKKGLGVTHILASFGFSSGTLLPIAIAEVDGRVAQAIGCMAIRMRKVEEKRRKFRNILIYPIVLFILIATLLMAFRRFFLPNMEALAISRKSEDDGFISALPTLVTKIPDVIISVVLVSALLTVVCTVVYKKLAPETKIRVLMSMPIAGTFFSIIKTRDFASEIGGLLQSGLSLQNALDVLIEQNLDAVLSEITKNVKAQVVFGDSFHTALGRTEGLMHQLAAFAKHGEDSGYLAKELQIYSEHLSQTIDEKLTKALAMLQPALFSIIAICILAAYLALLLPVYGMMDKL
ncbi:competence type IV pilus assembly protein ComGB [Sporosarcina sp. E16_8]|uniref:competence type IV pilus assembly protein ComGB n=1 Tax=Sporosarcina sp. E16_8 TaxID=2789295 RepID=UPI001A91F517|nr:competence type IV pilus assembly protein ComGB [Sporosarcina sp. E16_8]MBO0586440.1 type II secretion system F family protein [Sporosarcina sp. E16_8]